MQDLLDSNEVFLSDKDIFTKIWTSPRLVFKYINDNAYSKYVSILLILSGISGTFDKASQKNMGDGMSLLGLLGIRPLQDKFV